MISSTINSPLSTSIPDSVLSSPILTNNTYSPRRYAVTCPDLHQQLLPITFWRPGSNLDYLKQLVSASSSDIETPSVSPQFYNVDNGRPMPRGYFLVWCGRLHDNTARGRPGYWKLEMKKPMYGPARVIDKVTNRKFLWYDEIRRMEEEKCVLECFLLVSLWAKMSLIQYYRLSFVSLFNK